jgi:superfamily II DNA or RNA helicase
MDIAPAAAGGLWEHQHNAITTAREYLAATEVGRASALITLPTGTGKTGVIANVAMALLEVTGHRLVLTPWNALVDQLIDDLRGRFWQRIPEEQRPALLPVRRLPPSSQLDSLRTAAPTVFVATIAAISVASRKADAGAYDLAQTFAGFACVLVDEGHYEPAQEWSQAIRALERRTVLLTATPYRNDEKFFNVERDQWRYRFPHWKAEELRFVRKPEFVELEHATEPATFVDQLLDQIGARFESPDDVRAIVRCDTATTIRRLVKALQDRGESAIGVHETFPTDDATLLRSVPRPEQSAARFWVHQFKLIEGIDDPRFKVLAVYESLRNDRAIVQQIGRVLRNPAQDEDDMLALVVSRGDRDIARTWRAYRAFDGQDEADSVATLPQLVARVLDAQPDAFYYDGGYRIRINLDSPSAWEEFAFPLRTRVFRLARHPGPTLDDLERDTAYEWRGLDRAVFRTQEPDERTRILPFVTAENSRLLRAGTFIEPEFGYTVLRLDGDLLFLYDSAGNTPATVDDNFRRLRPPDLQALFPNGPSRLTSVSLLNTDVGQQAARSRHVRAAAIDDLAPDLADYAYVCTVAEGYTEIADERFRRYLGLSRSRVSDYRRGERDFATYSQWLDGLKAELADGSNCAVTFSRYATYVDEPDDKRAAHVLLDIDTTDYVRAGSETPLEIEDRAATVTDGEFSFVANGETRDASIHWDVRRGRYEVDAPSLAAELFMLREGERRELLAAINSDQSLRVVPVGGTTLYAHGSFFQPIIPATRVGSFRLLDVLYPITELATAGSEKGTAIVDDDWQPDSVFGLISALTPGSTRTAPAAMSSVLTSPDMVLCTDLGTEVADFVITEARRAVFIHAKASRTTRSYSASALHDVASQAIKNLPHLQPLSEISMATAAWTRPWSARPHVTGATRRLRHGPFTSGPEMRKHIRSVVATPDSDREIWLVLGNALSKGELQRQANRRPPATPEPEAIQVFSLLQTTWGAVSQLGARLRIFCSP